MKLIHPKTLARARNDFRTIGPALVLILSLGCGAQMDSDTPPPTASPEPAVQGSPAEDSATTAATLQPSTTIDPASMETALHPWPRFRGPTGMGTTTSKNLPQTWSSEQNIVWKTPLPGPGASSPVVSSTHIYLTCYTGYLVPGEPTGSLEDLKRHLIACDRVTGQIVWDRAVDARLPEESSIRDHGYAANTPVVDDDRVYVFFGKSGVIAFSHDGDRLWEADVGEGTSGWGTAASPILHGDLLLVNASVESESLVALNRNNGQQAWRVHHIREAWNTPLAITSPAGREELIIAAKDTLRAFDPQSGADLYSCQTDITWYMVPSVIAHDSVIYCLGGRSGVAALAVRCGGSGDVTLSHRLWTSNKGSNVSSPVYHDGHLYWVHEQRGMAFCAKADSGEGVYERRLQGAGQIYASALLGDGKIYYLNRAGRTFVLAARPRFEQLAVNNLNDGGGFNGSPAVDGSRLLIRSDKFLYCIGE